jgi:uncharacterized protein YecT (DUF1311 family)
MMLDRIGLSIFFALAVILVGASSSHAQNRQPTAAEIKLVRDCAAKHPDDGKGEEECAFKLVADPCVEKVNDNHGHADCFRIETVIWDAILNDNYKALTVALEDKEQEQKLKDMQRAWIAFRDTTCGFYWVKIQGTMAGPMTTACQLRETARRAMLLAFFMRV